LCHHVHSTDNDCGPNVDRTAQHSELFSNLEGQLPEKIPQYVNSNPGKLAMWLTAWV
jgi:hypothetical protein